ncbi:tetratricopeptide repeat protein [Paenibacillus glucanolyticus]|uniref:tetratricopeptide repeat protein n=1 Tax=Paenibacillus glucanolyticus TaxID=59843 RepID=UPI003D073FF6
MKIDLHTHAKLSKASDFSQTYYEEMVREAMDNGLHALALTEHFNTRNFDEVYQQLDRMFPYNGEYYDAGGLKIFPGMEVDIRETGHILLIGRKEFILETRHQLNDYTEKGAFIPFDDLMDLAEALPLLKIGAHPFRESTPLHHLDHSQLQRLDAFDLNAKDMYQYGCEANQDQVQRFAAKLGKPFYHLGKVLKWQGRLDEAYAYFYKSVWSGAWQGAGYLALAQIACEKQEYEEAFELIERSLAAQYRNYKARHLKSIILRRLGRLTEAELWLQETIKLDPMDAGARNELVNVYREQKQEDTSQRTLESLFQLMRDDPHHYIALAQDYADAGQYGDALDILKFIERRTSPAVYPMVHYYQGSYHMKMNQEEEASASYRMASAADPFYCFPNSLYDYVTLKQALKVYPDDAKALYYLGNLLYDKKRYEEAVSSWEASVALDDSFPTPQRNLALAYYNKRQDHAQALASLQTAFSLNPADARVFYELDQLYKKLGHAPADRLKAMEEHMELVELRDDLYLEYITLHNTLNRYEEALALILKRHFHPWEGGEGKVPTQYVLARVELAKGLLMEHRYEEAVTHLLAAKQYPLNINEGKLTGAQENNIDYYLGCAYEGIGRPEEAKIYFQRASEGLDEPTSAMYYNDQPPHMIFYQGAALRQLGRELEARSRFNKLIDYGEKHIFEPQSIDYFAVSLPDFLVFDEDLNRRNEIHCHYMMGLGYLGLNKRQDAEKHLGQALKLEPHHQGAAQHLALCSASI